MTDPSTHSQRMDTLVIADLRTRVTHRIVEPQPLIKAKSGDRILESIPSFTNELQMQNTSEPHR